MKLLYCPQCRDLVTLRDEVERTCECGRCSGRYIGLSKAVVRGPDVQVVAIANNEFAEVIARLLEPNGKIQIGDDYHEHRNEFTAWAYGPNALRITKTSNITERDKAEVHARLVLNYGESVNRIVWNLSRISAERREQFWRDVNEELERLAPYGKLERVSD